MTYLRWEFLYCCENVTTSWHHDDVIKWKHFPRYWPFVRGIHRSPVNSTHKGQWRGVLMFSLICACINGWVNNRKAGDLRRNRAHYDVIVMINTAPRGRQVLRHEEYDIVVCHDVCTWWQVTKFLGLSRDSGQRGPYSPYKPCNHSLYIGIIIFPHLDNTQSTGHK